MTLYHAVLSVLGHQLNGDELRAVTSAVIDVVTDWFESEGTDNRPTGACSARAEMRISGSQPKMLRYCRYDHNHAGAHRAIGDDGYTWADGDQT